MIYSHNYTNYLIKTDSYGQIEEVVDKDDLDDVIDTAMNRMDKIQLRNFANSLMEIIDDDEKITKEALFYEDAQPEDMDIITEIMEEE